MRQKAGRRLPVVICPYINPGEHEQIARTFAIDTADTKHIEFALWHDEHRIGPERAFEYLWGQYPDRDIVIVHSDMAPMPDEPPNRWFDELVRYAWAIPSAGMLACNLFFPPRDGEYEINVVQCAGGTFHDNVIHHITGPVTEHGDPPGTVPADLLRVVRPVPWVTFGGVFIRRSVLNACGPIDKRYHWAYVMDVDYCFEARTCGFPVMQVPVSLLHEPSQSTRAVVGDDDKLHRTVTTNMSIFHRKWRSRYDQLPAVGMPFVIESAPYAS